MKKQFILISCLAIFAAGTTVMSLTSCKKTANPNAQFVGTYGGRSSTNNNYVSDTLFITAGTTSTTVNILEQNTNTNYTATATGDSLIIGTQLSTVNNAGITFTSGSGVLTGSSLTFSSAGQFTSGSYFSYTFQGTK